MSDEIYYNGESENNVFKEDKGKISDGYHTFDELYDHRCLLYINLCLATPGMACWKIQPEFGDYKHCLYLVLPNGQISYHVPTKYSYLFTSKLLYDDSFEWDGHSSQEVVNRLLFAAEDAR